MSVGRAVVGVDLGGTKIAAAVVDATGATGTVHTCPTPAAAGPEAVLDAVAQLVRAAVSGADRCAGSAPPVTSRGGTADGSPTTQARLSLAAVGVGSAGVVEPRSGRVISATDAIAAWAGTDLAGGLRSRLGVPVTADNDVNAHAVGEAWLGAGRGMGTTVLVTAGTGVGAAIVVDGRPLAGRRHMVGEIGHLPAAGAQGLRCGCGRDGHLEAIASGPGLVRHAESLCGRRFVDARAVVAAAAAGDDDARRAVRDAATTLGTALAAIVTTVDPDRLVLGGGLAGAGPLWWDHVETAMRGELVDLLADVPLLAPALGAEAAIVGAARLARLSHDQTDSAPHPPPGQGRREGGDGMTTAIDGLPGGLVVSAQAYPGEPMRHPETMAQVAAAAVAGGAVAVRVQGLADIALAAERLTVPVIGLWKDGATGVFITPTLAHARAVRAAGAHIVALDGTRRERPDGLSLAETVRALRRDDAATLVMADCGSLDDALAAADAGADLVGTTLSGYTGERPKTDGPDLDLVADIAAALPDVPLVAEGRIHTPSQAAAALAAGAHSVVVGTAITHPTTITSWFVAGLTGGH